MGNDRTSPYVSNAYVMRAPFVFSWILRHVYTHTYICARVLIWTDFENLFYRFFSIFVGVNRREVVLKFWVVS